MSQEEKSKLNKKLAILIPSLIVFSILFYFNSVSTSVGPLDWTFAAGQAFITYQETEKQLFDIIEFWYLVALIIFLVLSLIPFAIILVIYSKRKRIGTRKFLLFSEIIFLAVVSLIPFFALHSARIVLDVGPVIDPEYDRQADYLKNQQVNSTQWSYGLLPLEQRAQTLQDYSFVIIGSYLSMLLVTSLMVLYVEKTKRFDEQKFYG